MHRNTDKHKRKSNVPCLLQECNKTLTLTNGGVDYNGTKVGDYATFTCDEGYTRTGDENATCMPSQDWTVYNVSCIPIGK